MKTSRESELADILEFVEFTNLFRKIERVMWYKGVEGRERDGEHSFQIALIGWFVNVRCKLNLDSGCIIRYALVHDLPETWAGDACWSPTNGHHSAPIEGKEKRERDARRRIAREWGRRFPELVQAMERYELQSDEESRFVYALDKLVPDLNIFCDEIGRTNKKVGVTRAIRDAYKGPRCAKHPAVGELFEALSRLFDEQPEYFHPASTPVAAE